MAKKQLSPAEQIELLERIKLSLDNRNQTFLCNLYFYINNPTYKTTTKYQNDWKSRRLQFTKQVPLFNHENAMQFGAKKNVKKNGAWWHMSEITLRRNYLDWMIEENKKLIK